MLCSTANIPCSSASKVLNIDSLALGCEASISLRAVGIDKRRAPVIGIGTMRFGSFQSK